MKKPNPDSNQWETTNINNTILLGFWSAGWLLTTALAAFGPKFLWNFDTLPTVLAILINLGVGFGMILMCIRNLKGQDELQQKIFFDAAAMSLGAGIVCGCSYELLEDIKLITFQPEISHLIILMGLTFGISVIAGHRRYG